MGREIEGAVSFLLFRECSVAGMQGESHGGGVSALRLSRTYKQQHPNTGKHRMSRLPRPEKYNPDGNDQRAKVTYFQADRREDLPSFIEQVGTRGLDDQVPSVQGLRAGMCEQTIPPTPLPRGHLGEEQHLRSVRRPGSATSIYKEGHEFT